MYSRAADVTLRDRRDEALVRLSELGVPLGTPPPRRRAPPRRLGWLGPLPRLPDVMLLRPALRQPPFRPSPTLPELPQPLVVPRRATDPELSTLSGPGPGDGRFVRQRCRRGRVLGRRTGQGARGRRTSKSRSVCRWLSACSWRTVSPCTFATLKMVSPFATTCQRWAGGGAAAAGATEATAAGLARRRRGPSSAARSRPASSCRPPWDREDREAGPGRGAEGLSGPGGPASARRTPAHHPVADASGCSMGQAELVCVRWEPLSHNRGEIPCGRGGCIGSRPGARGSFFPQIPQIPAPPLALLRTQGLKEHLHPKVLVAPWKKPGSSTCSHIVVIITAGGAAASLQRLCAPAGALEALP